MDTFLLILILIILLGPRACWGTIKLLFSVTVLGLVAVFLLAVIAF